MSVIQSWGPRASPLIIRCAVPNCTALHSASFPAVLRQPLIVPGGVASTVDCSRRCCVNR
eukprot:5280672-Pyramimonas_sp.AAC.1